MPRSYLFVGRLPVAIGDVVAQRPGEQPGLLGHNADLPAQHIQIYIANIDAVNQYAAYRRIIEPRDQVDKRAFSRSASPPGATTSPGLPRNEIFSRTSGASVVL